MANDNSGFACSSTPECYQPKKYKIRPGTIDFGKEYEYKMAAYLSLRCIFHNVEDMWMATNLETAGSFDDIILTTKTSGNDPISYLIQLKHKENQNKVSEGEFKSAEGDYSLLKYVNSMAKLQAEKTIKKWAAPCNTYFVLYTNRGVDKYDFLVETADEQMKILNTGVDKVVYSINPSTPNWNIKKDSNNLRILTNQIWCKHVERQIIEELVKFFASVNITVPNVRVIAENYVKFIGDWYKGKLGKHYYLTKQIVVGKLCELLLSAYEVRLDKELFCYTDCPRKTEWNIIMERQHETVVDYNEQVIAFLIEYIGSEVKKYCRDLHGVKIWADRFPTETKNRFYKEHSNIRREMLRTVGNNGYITLVDIYRCLCMIKKIPMLLEINNGEDYQNVSKIMKLFNFNFKVIIVNKTRGFLTLNQDKNHQFCSLQDLNKEEQRAILKNPVMLQGKPSAILGDIVEEEMYEHIKNSDIISVLCNTFSISKNLNPIPDNYVTRKFRKTFVSFKVTQLTLSFLGNDSSYLQWKSSYGSTKGIESFTYCSNDFKTDVAGYYNNTLNVISENPGMGKSTFMNFVALHAPTSKWVLRINFEDHLRYYRRFNYTAEACSHLNYFHHRQNDYKIDGMVFEKLLCRKALIVVLDGFDELLVSFKDEIMHIIQSLCDEGYPTWLTTSSGMKYLLDEGFNAQYLHLEPLIVYWLCCNRG